VINIKLLDDTEIKEKVELRWEAWSCIENKLITLPPFDIDEASVSQLKGWLFHIYLTLGMTQAYQNINKRSIRYRNKVRQSISEEGFILRKRVLKI